MLEVLRARLRRRRGRFAVISAVALLSGAVATAHSSVGEHHTAEAATMCLAIVVGGAAVAVLPVVRGRPPVQRAPLQPGGAGTPLQVTLATPHLARGDPALLQVFRR